MESPLWRRAQPLVEELLDLDAPARAARVAALAAEDPELHAFAADWLADAAATEVGGLSADALATALFAAEEVLPGRAGERVGPFRLGAELGHGGMGAVYEAERVEGGFGQRVAVKILKRGLDSEQVLRRFVAERRILARLEHPHIARLIDGGVTDDGLPWFALERVDGCTVTDHARGLDVPARVRLFLGVCGAVSFAHAQRVVHRDIKPSNVLVDGQGRVKLLDFGIAKLLDPSAERLTRTAARVYTPRYAAPEQVAGDAITVATDVWQLGRLLDELLPAARPADLSRIVARATHDEPGRRYPAVAALAEDLERFLDGRPVMARGDSLAYRASRFLRRHRTAAVAVAVAGLLAAALGARGRREAGPAPLRFQLVSTFPGSHRQASFSPDGLSIAFLSEDATGVPQVWTKALAAEKPVPLTRDPRGAHRPRWSPRGDQIVYDVPAQGLWSIAPGGGEPRQIRPLGYNPNFSRDGEHIVYEVGPHLWICRADGTQARRLGSGAAFTLEKEYAFVESAPAFSADGREAVYFQDRDSPVSGDLWAASVDGGHKRQLTFDDVQTRDPVAMPDGSGLVFSSARRGGVTLWFLPTGGGEPWPLTTGTGEDTEPAISPDGRRLLYTNARNLLRLTWLDPRTGEKRTLAENRSVLTHPSFSPDGRRVVFFQGGGRRNDLWIVQRDGTGLRQLTPGDPATVLPNWSLDGRWIYHYALPPAPGFRRIAPGGGPAEVLVPGWKFSHQHGAHVSPDHRRVAATWLEHGRAVETRVRDLQTGAETRLAAPILWPRWSPDGSVLVGRSNDRELTLCPPSGAPCRGLGFDGTEPRWSPDGRTVYFVRYAGYQGSRDPRTMPLWKVALDGSPPVHVADLDGPSAVHFFYDVAPTGEVAWASFIAGRQELWMADLR